MIDGRRSRVKITGNCFPDFLDVCGLRLPVQSCTSICGSICVFAWLATCSTQQTGRSAEGGVDSQAPTVRSTVDGSTGT